ncbi:hypothetical protein [Sutcliffiella halmapala]|uniref:hypothetical protein n=1 Tax=Sutcliffiella halmapala TaxID=79882 RepID=UPI000995CE2B|nr:hypothetical protein [Sutcliffiella halmapala]
MRKVYCFIVLIIVTIVFAGCNNNTQVNSTNSNDSSIVEEKDDNKVNGTDENEEEILTVEETAEHIVSLLSTKDFAELETLVHPEKGVRFTPYGYVNAEEDQVFSSKEVVDLWENDRSFLWGYYDGTGDPIELTFQEYYSRFVYDADYVNAKERSINQRLGQGNSLDNSKDIYPEGTVIEFHFPGFDEKYEGMDWKSLRLVLERDGDKWFLVGIIHDQWTI